MLGRVTVPILPMRSKSGLNIGSRGGASVAIYNAQGDGSAAVSDNGVVAATATLAYVYQDRAGATLMPNPATCDEIGGPIDLHSTGGGVNFSFFGFPGVYHLLVVMPNGQRFGIPFVRVGEPTDRRRVEVDLCARYSNNGSAGRSNPMANIDHKATTGFSLDVLAHAHQWHIDNTAAPAIDACMWIGEKEALACSTGDDEYAGLASEGATLVDVGTSSLGWWGRQSVLETTQVVSENAASLNASSWAGFGLGNLQGAASLYAIAASPASPIIIIYHKLSDNTWHLLSARGNSTAYSDVQLAGVSAPALGVPANLRLVVDGINGRALAFVNGVLGGSITNASKLPLRGSNTMTGFHGFAQVGSSTAAVIDVFWIGAHRKVYFESLG